MMTRVREEEEKVESNQLQEIPFVVCPKKRSDSSCQSSLPTLLFRCSWEWGWEWERLSSGEVDSGDGNSGAVRQQSRELARLLELEVLLRSSRRTFRAREPRVARRQSRAESAP
jgi:hypothetical protein